MDFSNRTAWDLRENDFALALRQAKSAGKSLIDLTVSNPTAVGFEYDTEALLAPLTSKVALQYEPCAFGMLSAREAVSQYYADRGEEISPANVCLTTSTNEAYSFLFRLLCDVGDEVLIARPSYPLFDFIASLDDVRLREYPLFYDDDWHIDLQSLEAMITLRTKAVIVVHPNNPTGNYASVIEAEALRRICAERGVALIVDEVFLDYALPSKARESFVAGDSEALTFILSGVSKVCALPQMKLSWIATIGPEILVRSASERLEVIADTFLSVGATTQHALPHWLKLRGGIQRQILQRTQENLGSLQELLLGSHAAALSLHGGWTVVLRIPRDVCSVPFALAALEKGVITQPGEFYGLSAGYVVMSLLTPPEMWKQGIALLPVT